MEQITWRAFGRLSSESKIFFSAGVPALILCSKSPAVVAQWAVYLFSGADCNLLNKLIVGLFCLLQLFCFLFFSQQGLNGRGKDRHSFQLAQGEGMWLEVWKEGKRMGRKEGRLTWSFCSAASSATWTLSLTLAKASYFSSSRVVHRAWSSPTFLSQTLCSLRTASASRDAASSLAAGEKWEWLPAALGTPRPPKWVIAELLLHILISKNNVIIKAQVIHLKTSPRFHGAV